MSRFPFYIPNRQHQIPSDKCYYCERWVGYTGSSSSLKRTIDHVRPKSKHLVSKVLVVACHTCNEAKADHEPEIFLEKVKIALQLQEDYVDIPHHVMGTVAKNISMLLQSKVKPMRNHPVTSRIHCCSLSQLREEMCTGLDRPTVNLLHDHFILDLKILMLSTLRYIPKLLLELQCRNMSKSYFDKLIATLADLGWIIEFGSELPHKPRRKYYALTLPGIKALGLYPIS